MAKFIEKTIESATPPAQRNVLWLDVSVPTAPVLKSFVNGAWKDCSSEVPQVEQLKEDVRNLQTGKVDVVEGKGLSSNDFTNEDKEKVTQLPTAEALATALGDKVDKVEGKGLSTEDYTSEEKTKLAGIEEGAEKNTVTSVAGKTGEVTLGSSDVGLGNVTNDAQVKRAEMGAANGVATLDANGLLNLGQVPNMIDLVSYGISWRTDQSTPVCTRIGSPVLHKALPIQSMMRGCVHTGKVVNYWLNANNWAYKEDGTTPSVLDGTDGTVGVYIPKFYGKSGGEGVTRWVRISTVKVDDTWEEIPEAIVGAYRCTVDGTNSSSQKAVSVVNNTANYRGGGNRTAYDDYASNIFKTDLGKPRTAIARSTMRGYARNAGAELMYYNYYKWMCWLYYIEYANFNVQAAFNAQPDAFGFKQGGLGAGISNMNGTEWNNFNGYYPLIPCGYTNEFGNGTNVKATGSITDGTATPGSGDVPRWRGIEQPFGDIWTNLDGIIINCYVDDNDQYHRSYYATSTPADFGDDATALAKMTFVGEEVQSNGYVGEFVLGTTGEMVPADVSGSSTTKKCDYHYQDSPNTGYRTLRVGGNAGVGASAGLAYFSSSHGVGNSNASIGFRTITLL